MEANSTFSPIEEIFLKKAKGRLRGLVPQVWVAGKYRVDFYVPTKGVVIELDGHDYHSDKD